MCSWSEQFSQDNTQVVGSRQHLVAFADNHVFSQPTATLRPRVADVTKAPFAYLAAAPLSGRF